MFLKQANQDLQPVTIIILGKSIENCSFIIHDAIQGGHWLILPATINPFVAILQVKC